MLGHKPAHEVRGTSGRGLSVVEAVRRCGRHRYRRKQSVSAKGHAVRATLACLGRQSQARAVQRVTKALVSRMPRFAGDRPVALAMPVKAPLPNLWRTCGRRERGTDARESAWSNLRRRAPCSRRWKASRSAGWRCPSRDVVGKQASIGPYVGSGSPPLSTHAPMTADVQRTPRKGTTSACALRSSCTGRERLRASPVTAVDASFARSSDPCRSSPLQLRGATRGGGALESASRSGKPGESQEEPAPGPSRVDAARLAACTPLRKEAAWHVRRGRTSRRPSPRGSRELGAECPFVAVVAEIGRRRRVPNKLVKRAPKRAARGE